MVVMDVTSLTMTINLLVVLTALLEFYLIHPVGHRFRSGNLSR